MMHNGKALERTGFGVAGGFVGTMAIQAMLTASQKWLPQAAPPIRQDPGRFMVKNAERVLPSKVRSSVPSTVETGAAHALAVGYGLAFGALYAALRPRGGNTLLDGALLGLGCWSIGYLGWLPATGLTPPITRQQPIRILGPLVDHAVYGIATVGTFNALRKRLE